MYVRKRQFNSSSVFNNKKTSGNARPQQRNSIVMKSEKIIELLQEALTGQQSLRHDREDEKCERFANSQPLVSIPMTWKWDMPNVPIVQEFVSDAPQGAKIAPDPRDKNRMIVPRAYLGKLQNILEKIEQDTGTRQPDGSVLEKAGHEVRGPDGRVTHIEVGDLLGEILHQELL